MVSVQESTDSDASPLLPNIKLESLFETIRIQVCPKYYKAILYIPVSLILLIVRLIAALFGFSILQLLPRSSPKRHSVFKRLCRTLGLVIEVDAKHIDDNAKILVANHLSILDRLAVNAMVPCSTVSTEDFRVTIVNSLSFWKDVDVRYSRDVTDDEIWTLQRSIEESSLPLLHFPEGATTNGKIGLLKFHPGVFSLNVAIQPVLIKVSLSSSFMTVSPSVLGSTVWSDVFWSLVLPSTHYYLRTLPSMVKLPNESPQDFSVRVQAAISSALNVEPTIHTSSDKMELTKRLLAPVYVSSSSPVSQTSNQMAEGSLQNSKDFQKSSHKKLTMDTSAETFGKTPKERMASYRDRRAILLEAARQKYLEKHSD
ncbi:hypothetical protein JTE90_002624 [Oedothorax gibbosus]|uniref:Phospholipid/glycerol acyltransferase domain-containing protein n=1 Tax=Oedothorax gibbosus TaxID=931172 RepID=A0AAV6VHL3_9ARAC|nr:hypothetical protein JTE90_002624 [Oedothorax gibbosus]